MKKLLGLLILAGVLLVSCSKEEAQVNTNFDDKVVVNNNAGDLSSMLKVVDQPIVLNTSGLKATNNPPMLTLKGRFDSPVVNGAILSSSDVFYSANYPSKVYATFHARGEDYAGAVVVFDVSGLGVPTPVSLMTFTKTDFNSLTIGTIGGDDYIFLAGSNKAWGAVVIKTKLIGGLISQNFADITYTKLNDGALNPYNHATNVASANSVTFVTKDGVPQYDVIVAAGFTNGGIFRYNAVDMSLRQSKIAMEGAKFTSAILPLNPPKLFALQSTAGNGFLHSYDFTLLTWTNAITATATWPLDLGYSIYHQYAAGGYETAGKNTLFVRGNTIYVAAGKSGMKAYDATTKALLYQAPFDMLSHGNTNGVSADDDYVYMANGEDGLYLGEVETYGATNVLSIVGYWDNSNVNGPAGQIASANSVTSTGTYIFVAKGVDTGFGGLAILQKP